MEIKLRQLKEGTKCLMLSVELSAHCALPSDHRSKIQTLFQAMNFAGNRRLATTLVTFILFTFGFTLFNSASSIQVLKPLWLKNAVLHQEQKQYIINI